MDIDWKQLAKSEGYKSLKAAYIDGAIRAAKQKHPVRNKEALYKNFQWVINRAKHYASITNIPIEEVLEAWERERTYCVLNYYQDSRQPRFHSNSLRLRSIRGIRKLYRQNSFYRDDPVRRKRRVMECISDEQRRKSTKEKPRWSAARKKRGY